MQGLEIAGSAAMNVSVGRDWEEYVKGKVASGDYATASEVVRESLRLLREKDLVLEARLQALRGEIQLGLDQAESGQGLDGPAVMSELREAIMRRRG